MLLTVDYPFVNTATLSAPTGVLPAAVGVSRAGRINVTRLLTKDEFRTKTKYFGGDEDKDRTLYRFFPGHGGLTQVYRGRTELPSFTDFK